MTPLFSARRRAEEFATVIDGAAPRVRSAETDNLLEVVTTLRSHEPVRPRDEFAADLRSRLMLEAETVLSPQGATLALPTRTRGPRERRLVAAASALVLVGGTTGLAAAAQQSLPGEALYPIKRGIEAAQAGLNFTDAGRGSDLLTHAQGRLVEVEGLLASDLEPALGRPRITSTLADFTRTAQQGSTLLFDAFRETRDPEAIVEVRTFVADAVEELERLSQSAPREAQPAIAVAALMLRDVDRAARTLCPGCTAWGDLRLTGALLAHAEAAEALARTAGFAGGNNHPVVVDRALLRFTQAAARTGNADESGRDRRSQRKRGVSATGPTVPGTRSGDPVRTAPLDPGEWPALLPDLGDPLPGGTSSGSKQGAKQGGSGGSTDGKVGGTVDNTLEGVGGTVGGVTGGVTGGTTSGPEGTKDDTKEGTKTPLPSKVTEPVEEIIEPVKPVETILPDPGDLLP